MTITLHQQIACAAREAAMRKNFYRKRVADGKMSQKAADHELAAMSAIVTTLKLVGEALEWERDAFDQDLPVEGAEVVEWFAGWRARMFDAAPLKEPDHG